MPAKNSSPSVNALSGKQVQYLLDNAGALRLAVTELANGTVVIDAGINGGLEVGRLIAEICMGGLGQVNIRASSGAEHWSWHVDVHSAEPIIACLGSQYAGWHLAYGEGSSAFNALGSGPGRALGSKEKLFAELGYQDKADIACLVIETDNMPPVELADKIAQMCGLPATKLTFILVPVSSLAGGVQVVARVLETALHKAHALDFPLSQILDGAGSAPIPPPVKNNMAAMGRGNDAILFAGQVHLFVQADDAEAKHLAENLPSSAVSDYGKPFAQIFKDVGYDFYKIDPMLFSPAKVAVTAVKSGNTFHAGKIDQTLLDLSFGNT